MLHRSGSIRGSDLLSQLRNTVVFVASVLGLYWLQPATAIRGMDFWLPTATLALCTVVWAATALTIERRALLIDVAALLGLVVLIAATRFVPAISTVLTRSAPPALPQVLMGIALVGGLAVALRRVAAARAVTWTVLFAACIVMLILIKSEPLAQSVAAGLRMLQGQDPARAAATDWRWLGFSYVAFRLMSVLRDRSAGRLPALRLRELLSYAVFAPALQAGPIDRPDRFVKDLRTPYAPSWDMLLMAGQRLVIGAFKKYALADTLGLIALSDANAPFVRPWWAWLLVYAYALRIWLDFSGYTDIALGIARLAGIALPENFNAPYLRPNLTQFWNNWHMSLSQWFRAYWFNPLTRALRKREWSQAPIVLLGQSSTMLMIALWHGVTANFVIWGLWHAAGLFVHNRWADFAKTRLAWVSERPQLQRALNFTGAVLTFHFVALGWVWFALSSTSAALTVLRRLVGL
jgi:alginate O-acetyltransferase complex protein AlgI